jgi:AcrR family transcriptional regulator
VAAREAFGELGFDHASLEDIAARIGVTKPAVYRHFPSKEELFAAVLRRSVDEMERTVRDVLTRTPAGEDGGMARACLEATFALIDVQPFTWRVLVPEDPPSEPIRAARAHADAVAQRQAMVLLRSLRPDLGLRDLEPRSEDDRCWAMMALGVQAQAARWWLRNPGASLSDVVDRVLGMLQSGAGSR